MKLPNKIIIFSIPYKIIYCDKPSDVDSKREDSLWGQINHWGKEIRLYNHKDSPETTFQVLIHEVLHGIVHHLNIKAISDSNDGESIIDQLATGITDILLRNKFVVFE